MPKYTILKLQGNRRQDGKVSLSFETVFDPAGKTAQIDAADEDKAIKSAVLILSAFNCPLYKEDSKTPLYYLGLFTEPEELGEFELYAVTK